MAIGLGLYRTPLVGMGKSEARLLCIWAGHEVPAGLKMTDVQLKARVKQFEAANVVYVPALYTSVAQSSAAFEGVAQFLDIFYLSAVISTGSTSHSTSSDAQRLSGPVELGYCTSIR